MQLTANRGHEGSLGARIARGALAGVVAAVVMGLFAMTAAATYQETGLLTPLYHIASSVGSPDAMMRSMERAAQGDLVTFAAADALLGAAIHLAWGAVWGAVFFALAYGLGLRGWGAIVAGVAYGLLVMVFMSLVTLPITASLFGGGAPIRDMPQMVGWGTFSLEHALFGLVIGVGVALAARTTVTAEEPARLEQRRAAA